MKPPQKVPGSLPIQNPVLANPSIGGSWSRDRILKEKDSIVKRKQVG